MPIWRRRGRYTDRKSQPLRAPVSAMSVQTGIAALNALEAQERIAISQERASYFERQLRSLDELLADGGTTITERANVASQLAEARAIIVELQLQRDQAIQRVTIDTGLAIPMCETDAQASYLRGALGVFPDVDTAIESAIEKNPASKALQSRVRAALFGRGAIGAFG